MVQYLWRHESILINCRHTLTPYIEGISENNEQQVPEEDAVAEFELTQKQRYLERQIRKAKESLRLAETTGDEDAIAKYKKQVRNRQATLRNFIKDNGLARQRAREQII